VINTLPAATPKGPQSTRVFVKNSLANLVGGVSTAALNLCVPPILSRYLSRPEFSAWTLILQLATYTALLGLGTQGAVSRFVAYHLAHGHRRAANEFVSTALLLLLVTAAVALLAVGAISENISNLFPALPSFLFGTSRTALLITGSTLAVGLPLGAIAAVFTGVQRNELVAAIQGGSRLILAGVLVATAIAYQSMVVMAIAFCAVNLVAYVSYWVINYRLAIVDISPKFVTRSALHELWTYCGTVVVWMLAMFLINGLDTAIVGRVEFSAVGVYGACIGPALLISGIQQAVFGPLLQFGAAQSAQTSGGNLTALLTRAVRLSTLLLLSLSIPLLIYSRELLDWWLGSQYADLSSMIFRPLLIGNVVRLVATPYTLLLLATLKHRQVLVTPVIEGVANFTVAVAAGMRFGAVGVAYGVVAGAFVGQLMNYFINFPQTTELVGNRRALVWKGIAMPVLCVSPSLLVIVIEPFNTHTTSRVAMSLVALVISGVLAWRLTLEHDEKALIESIASRIKRTLAPL
jgi:O-antigen/teichoic acid export membrane protein